MKIWRWRWSDFDFCVKIWRSAGAEEDDQMTKLYSSQAKPTQSSYSDAFHWPVLKWRNGCFPSVLFAYYDSFRTVVSWLQKWILSWIYFSYCFALFYLNPSFYLQIDSRFPQRRNIMAMNCQQGVYTAQNGKKMRNFFCYMCSFMTSFYGFLLWRDKRFLL